MRFLNIKNIKRLFFILPLFLDSCISSNFSEILAEKSIKRKGINAQTGDKLIITRLQNDWYLVGNTVCYNLSYDDYFSYVHNLNKIKRTRDVVHKIYPDRLYLKLEKNTLDDLRNFSTLSCTKQAKLQAVLSDCAHSGEWKKLSHVEGFEEISFKGQLRVVNLEKKESLYTLPSSSAVYLLLDVPVSIGVTIISPLVIVYGFITGKGW